MLTADPIAYPRSTQAWWLLCVLCVIACISYADRLVLSVLVDPLRQSLDLTDSAVGVLQGPAFTVVYVFSSLLFGRLADRRIRTNLLLAGATCWCLCTMLCALAGSFSTFLMARMLVGVSEATLIPPAISMIADAFAPQRRGTAVGLFTMGTCIGGPLGITAGGVLLAASQGGLLSSTPLGALEPWRQALLLMGLIGLLGPALLLSVREPPRRQSALHTELGPALWFFVRRGRLLAPLYLAMALLAVGDYGLVSWVPTTLSRRFSWPADRVGAMFGVVSALASIAGALLGGWISDIADRRAGIRGRLLTSAAAALAAAAAAGAISANHAWCVGAGLGLWIFASVCAAVGGVATLQELVPSRFRGTGVSILTFGNTLLGLGLGPNLVTLVTEHVYGWPAAVGFAVSTVIVPAGIMACIMFLGVASARALVESLD